MRNFIALARDIKARYTLSLHGRLLRNKIKNRPAASILDPLWHEELGQGYSALGKWFEAIAEYRTSESLGNNSGRVRLSLARAYIGSGQVELAMSKCRQVLDEGQSEFASEAQKITGEAKTAGSKPLTFLPATTYSRMRALAQHLSGLFEGPGFSVLDVGGGNGALSLFLPESRYVLAEPSVNGISGEKLPFAGKFFDAVVSCHVLEHVPPECRTAFLDSLCSKAKKYVLLLNPVADPMQQDLERLKLLVEITGADWAKEHLECTLPDLSELRKFAESRNYGYREMPNGSRAAALALVFMRHYASRSVFNFLKRKMELERIDNFFNTVLLDSLDNKNSPNDYLIELKVS